MGREIQKAQESEGLGLFLTSYDYVPLMYYSSIQPKVEMKRRFLKWNDNKTSKQYKVLNYFKFTM